MPLQVLNLTIFIFIFCFHSAEAKPVKPVKPAVALKPDEGVKPVEPVRPVEPVKPRKPAGAVSMFGGVDLFGASKSPPSSAAAAKPHVTPKPKGERLKHWLSVLNLLLSLLLHVLACNFKRRKGCCPTSQLIVYHSSVYRHPWRFWRTDVGSVQNVCHVWTYKSSSSSLSSLSSFLLSQ